MLQQNAAKASWAILRVTLGCWCRAGSECAELTSDRTAGLGSNLVSEAVQYRGIGRSLPSENSNKSNINKNLQTEVSWFVLSGGCGTEVRIQQVRK